MTRRQKKGGKMCNMWREGIGGSVALSFGLWGVGREEKRGFRAAETKSGAETDCGDRSLVRKGGKRKKE